MLLETCIANLQFNTGTFARLSMNFNFEMISITEETDA
jgi:hypothetical protein